MTDIKLTVAIPYRQRLDNLRIALEGLARQTMDMTEFEVVVGAMEYSADYVTACRSYLDRLDLVSVLSPREFDIPDARNLAMRQASGRVVVHMDADTLLPAGALQNLWDRHFAFGQEACVVGQVVGYGNNNDGDVDTVQIHPFGHYEQRLDELGTALDRPEDPRFQAEHVIPWAFAWTGLIALPMDTVRRHGLYFDQDFRGWGVDDLEWGYRICRSGTPILLRRDVYALHLPHLRNAAANQVTEAGNYRRFLRKWPLPDVELAHTFGDVAANELYLDLLHDVRRAAGGHGCTLGTAAGSAGGRRVVVVGAVLGADGHPFDPAVLAGFDDAAPVEVLPLLGIALPYAAGSVDECRLLPPIATLAPRYRDAVEREVDRLTTATAAAG